MISDTKLKFANQKPGKGGRQHPLNFLIANKLDGRSKRQLALDIGIRAQTLYGWEREARENPRTFLLPSIRARQIAEWFGVKPALLRPDLWV